MAFVGVRRGFAPLPEFLGKLVMCGANKLRFKPSVAQIKAHYYKMFRGKGAADEDEDEAQ